VEKQETYVTAQASPPLTNFKAVNPQTDLRTLNLNWTEKELPERKRTKHVHRLHPYLGKFIPQLVEIFLRKYQPKVVCDPFCGSGTTLVEANALGIDSIGCDVSTFNCLLSKVKTDKYDVQELEKEINDIRMKLHLALRSPLFGEEVEDTDNEYLRTWYASKARRELLYFRKLIPNYKYQDLLKVVLSRAARSARLTTHFDLDFPKMPQREPYYCYKHRRTCRPTKKAIHFLDRYLVDTLRRIKQFAKIRTDARVQIIPGDARTVAFPAHDLVITSPPYVGLIDYHEQHRYAFELLELEAKDDLEIGAASKGNSKAAQEAYITGIEEVFANASKSLAPEGVVIIIVHDKNALYADIAPQLGFELEYKLERHVNRRTGRRANEFYEDILVWRKT